LSLASPASWLSRLSPRRKMQIDRLIVAFAGLLFGFALGTGLGLNRIASLAVGLIVGVGVFFANSIVTYLVIQTLSLAVLGVGFYVLIRAVPGFQIDAIFVQATYLFVMVLSPAVLLSGKVRSAFSNLSARPISQLLAVFFFTGLVRHLRQSRPSDPDYALSMMYSAEDNAGVVSILAKSIKDGVTPHASLFGEFFNGIYLTASYLISAFGQSSANDFLPALTHWNITTLFLAWAPLAALLVIVLSGKGFRPVAEIFVVGLSSAVMIVLFWPFVPLGHTSVISSGLFAAALLAITLNRGWARSNPVFYVSVSSALAFIVANTWFPLMPLAAATTAAIFLAVVFSNYNQQVKRISFFLIVGFLVLSLILLPEILKRVQDSGAYLQMVGGTRTASELLILLWLAISGMVIWKYSKSLRGVLSVGKPLFLTVLVFLLASNVAIYINGLANNSLTPGYGASKYIMVSVAFSMPVFFMLLTRNRFEKGRLVRIIGSGLVVIFAILFVQPDSRATAVSFVTPAPAVNFDNSRVGVFKTIKTALSKNPDHVFCVSDYGFPYYGDVNMDSYFCTRWAQSLLGDEGGSEWRFVPLGRIPQESLLPVIETFMNKKVLVLRFSKSDMPLLEKDTWWAPYVDDSWEIIPVG
jgi:hypothetical protein